MKTLKYLLRSEYLRQRTANFEFALRNAYSFFRLAKVLRSGLIFFLAVAAIAIPLMRVQAMTDVPCETSALINAIQDAVDAGGAQELALAENCTYTLTTVNNGAGTLWRMDSLSLQTMLN